MKRLTFYKPNSKNTGAAFQISIGKNNELFFKITKQSTWDDSKKRGSFKDNVNNPQKSMASKLNALEAASMINSINTKAEFKTYHKSKNQNLMINFGLMIDKTTNQEKGFSLRILKEEATNSVDKIQFSMGFYPNEALLLKMFLKEYIKVSFEEEVQSQEEISESLNQQPTSKPTENSTSSQDEEW